MLSNWAKSKFNGEKLYYKTDKQLKICGAVIEVRLFGKDFFVGGRPEKEKKERVEKTGVEDVDKELAKQQRLWRAKRQFHDHINCNAYAWPDSYGHIDPPLFITLTFGDNITDIKFANYEFTKYIQRLNFFITKNKKSFLRYIVVIEFQKRGAIHYHIMFFNLPFISDIKKKIVEVWGQGFINVKSTKNVDELKKIIRYMSKYMSKNFDDSRLHGKKCYFVSKQLKKPRFVYFDDQINELLDFVPPETLEYHSDKKTEGYIPLLDYKRYNLINNPDILKQLLAFLDITGYDILETVPTKLDQEAYDNNKRPIELPEF